MLPSEEDARRAVVGATRTVAAFEWVLRVRYQETDQQGVVYHSRYLEYFDVAMTEFFRVNGWDYTELVLLGCDPSVVTTTLDYFKPARFEDMVSIAVTPRAIGNSSFTLQFDLKRDGEVLVTGRTVYVNMDPATTKSRPLPQPVRSKLSLHLVDAAP